MKRTVLLVCAILIFTLSFSLTAMAADYATVDMSKVTSTGIGETNTGFTPETVFDGDETTRWGSMNAGESVTAVFDKEYVIEAVEMRFFRAGVREHLFTFEYSLDGNTWTEIKSTKEYSTADPSLQLSIEEEGYFETFPLVNAVTAKQFRYTYEGRNDGATIGSLWDIKFVVGAAAAVETPAVETPVVETPAVETPAVETPAVPVVEEPAAVSQPTPAPVNSAPATGDVTVLMVVLCVAAALAFAVVCRKKVNSK